MLPSPAPSDEPSPAALWHHKDSPNSQIASLPAVSRAHQNTGTVRVASEVPTFVDPAMLANASASASPAPEIDNDERAASPVSQALHHLLSQAAQPPHLMPPPDLPSTNQAHQIPDGIVDSGSGLGDGRQEARARQSSIGSRDEQPNKRMRVEYVITGSSDRSARKLTCM